ncbi:MAG: uncharacterized protein QOG79_6948 [Mycobacterium sp.]|nr:uncharacterized protein [Mycobacterium sp.]
MTDTYRSDIRDGMIIEWDVAIPMDDGQVLRADVFRPEGPGTHPVLLSHGPYAKGAPFQIGYAGTWNRLAQDYPEATMSSTNKYQNFEVVDPETWVPLGYACIRVDSRGSGRSPGHLNPLSPRETSDFRSCIEWAGTQSWSNGKVGLTGISYYAQNQWQVAATQPPHLAAMCIWEGSSDWYREVARHGGIMSGFGARWYESIIAPVQYGRGARGWYNPITGQPASGDITLADEELAASRVDYAEQIRSQVLDDDHNERYVDLDKVTVPLLSAANWGGQGLHLRGNVEGFLHATSTQKWLEVHGREHWADFYTDYGVELQRRFFDHFLLGVDNGWDVEPPLMLNIRHVDGTFTARTEEAWPLPRTQWTTLYLNGKSLSSDPAAAKTSASFDAGTGNLTFTTEPLAETTEITGPLAARLFVSSSTTDADLFLVVRAFSPDGEEVTFQGALDPHSAVTKGWLRASHRKLDADRSTQYRPYHTHDEIQPLTPETVYQLDIEIWPASVVLPPGYRLALTVQGRDWRHPNAVNAGRLLNFDIALRGSGPFQHDDPTDRPTDIFRGRSTIHAGGDTASWLQLPVVTPKPQEALSDGKRAHAGGRL